MGQASNNSSFTMLAGPYAVGFRALDLIDATRTYRANVSFNGAPQMRDRARPVQTSIWYPAVKGTGQALRYGDYLDLWSRQDGKPSAAQVREFRQMLRRACAETRSRSECDVLFEASVSARRDAQAARGRHPVVVYNAGGGKPSFDNSVLDEYLASYGYVVIASPNTWNWSQTRRVGKSIESAEASARDIEFHIGYARYLQYADTKKLAVMGYSWGGLAATLVGMRNSAVQAVVSLDGSIRNPGKLYESAPLHDPDTLCGAFLQLSSNPARSLLGARLRGHAVSEEMLTAQPPFEFFDALRNVDAYSGTMLHFHHGNFSAFDTLFDTDRVAGEPTLADDLEGYAVMAETVRHFLDAYVRRDSVALAWLQQPVARPDVIQLTEKRASRALPNTVEAYAAYLHRHGLDALKSAVVRERASDAGYGLSELEIEEWAHQLGHEDREDLAHALRRLAVELSVNRSQGAK